MHIASFHSPLQKALRFGEGNLNDTLPVGLNKAQTADIVAGIQQKKAHRLSEQEIAALKKARELMEKTISSYDRINIFAYSSTTVTCDPVRGQEAIEALFLADVQASGLKKLWKRWHRVEDLTKICNFQDDQATVLKMLLREFADISINGETLVDIKKYSNFRLSETGRKVLGDLLYEKQQETQAHD